MLQYIADSRYKCVFVTVESVRQNRFLERIVHNRVELLAHKIGTPLAVRDFSGSVFPHLTDYEHIFILVFDTRT